MHRLQEVTHTTEAGGYPHRLRSAPKSHYQTPCLSHHSDHPLAYVPFIHAGPTCSDLFTSGWGLSNSVLPSSQQGLLKPSLWFPLPDKI